MKPNDRHGPPEEIFAGLAPPAPPRELKNDVIAAVHSAWENESRSDTWTRLWYHRGLRAAWAGAVALLLFGHIFVPSRLSTREVVTADPRPDVEMADFLRPTRIVASATPNVGRFRSESPEISTLSMGGSG